jgi:hypothetical protein
VIEQQHVKHYPPMTRIFGPYLATVGRILRQGSGSEVTLKHYIDVQDETKADAMKSLPLKSRRA